MSTASSRPLTYDMQLAAESAFQGRPINPRWSQAAQTIYRGIWNAKYGTNPGDPTLTSDHTTLDLRPTAHYSQATPFLHKPLQAWHMTYDDGEHILLLFPHHANTEFILNITKEIAGNRPFTMHPIQYGHFHIHWPTNDTVQTLYSHDIRVMDHNGMLHIPARLPKRPPQEHIE